MQHNTQLGSVATEILLSSIICRKAGHSGLKHGMFNVDSLIGRVDELV